MPLANSFAFVIWLISNWNELCGLLLLCFGYFRKLESLPNLDSPQNASYNQRGVFG